LARIDRLHDREIDYTDIPPLDKRFLKKATTAWPPAKKQLTIRLDADVLAWLKAHGKGYQARLIERCITNRKILRPVLQVVYEACGDGGGVGAATAASRATAGGLA